MKFKKEELIELAKMVDEDFSTSEIVSRFNCCKSVIEEKIDIIQTVEKELWVEACEELNLTAEQFSVLREVLVLIPRHLLPQSPDLFGDMELMRCHYMRLKVKEILQKDSEVAIKNKFLSCILMMSIR